MSVVGEVRRVRVFVSSPGDVAAERGRVQAVAAKLNAELEGFVRFETVLWEEHFYKADGTFQAQIPHSAGCDVVVSIFWTRIGTELPTDFALMADGRPYPSGTAYELIAALEASRHNGVPDVYVFRKTADAALPTTDAVRRREAQRQLDALEAFWNDWFRSETGQFKAAFQTFAGTDEFERQLEKLLRQWLDTRGLLERSLAWPPEKGSPFRGLAAFEAEHSAVFFGRDRAIDEAWRRLSAAAARGTPFLLIVGASGAGKSSLARAGLIPRLTTPGVIPGVHLWRVARVKPGDGETGPVAALAAALLGAGALPELAQGDFPTPERLADNFRRGSQAAVQPVVRALARAAEDEGRKRNAEEPAPAVLLLLVDQLEELFAHGIGDAERAAYSECVALLAGTTRVWCVATLRADLYEQLLGQSALKALKEAGASLDLGPPGAAELAEIVRAPAAAAGLAFEHDTDKGALDERILADAKTADGLPLLQFTLQQLYARRVAAEGGARLTHTVYDSLGGLEGAIAQEAERAVAGLAPEVLAALPRLLRRVAEPARTGAALTLRDAVQAEIATDEAENALAQALLGARILIAGTDASGRPTVRLAHDAVFASWPRAKEAAQASRDFYRVRADVEHAERRWREHQHPKELLIPAGVPLAEAERLVADFAPELPEPLVAYVASSRNRARARQRVLSAAAVFFFLLAVAATGAGLFAFHARQQAVTAEQHALSERDQALLTQSRLLADRANQSTDGYDAATAMLLALEALADQDGGFSRPYAPEAEVALFSARHRLQERTVLAGHTHFVIDASFSPDARLIATASSDDTARVWDAASGTTKLVLQGHTGSVWTARFSPGGDEIVTASGDKTARIWDTRTGKTIRVLTGHTDIVRSASFSADGLFIVTTSTDKTARIWNTKTGATTKVLIGHTDEVGGAGFSPDGQLVFTTSADQTARLWDVQTGATLAVLETGNSYKKNSALFTPDGEHVLTVAGDGNVIT
jgi:eukaryotic-like serine/threonine-protein kinase